MRTIKMTLFALVATLLLAAPALAFPNSMNNFTTNASAMSYLSELSAGTVPSGLWDLTTIYKEAGHLNEFWLPGSTSALLDNALPQGDTAGSVNLAGSYFVDAADWQTPKRQFLISSDAVRIFNVETAFTYAGFDFGVGDMLIGFNDLGGDSDYEDMVLRATAATPIPGAAWLLGSGLLGLVGLRRKFS